MARPHVTLKLATSLDGKIALANGQSQWITSEQSRQKGRELRAIHDAIAIGSNTAIEDNPRLTTRIDGANDPIRIVYDSRLRLSATSNLAMTALDVPVWLFTSFKSKQCGKHLIKKGISIVKTSSNDSANIEESLEIMSERRVKTLLVEGGGTLASSFLCAGFVDSIHWFRAPIILGGDGRNGIGNLGMIDLDQSPKFTRKSFETLGPDTYEIFEKAY